MKRRKFINLLGLAPFVAKFGIGIKPDKLIITSSTATVDIAARSWTGQIVRDINSMAEQMKESTGITPSRIIMSDENYKLLSESESLWEGSSTSIMEYITKGPT